MDARDVLRSPRAVGAAPRPDSRLALPMSVGRSPWTLNDLTRLAAVYAATGTSIVVCWVALSTKIRFTTQLAWLVVAIGALVVVGCSSGRWLLAGFRRVNQLEQVVAARVPALEAAVLTLRESLSSAVPRGAAVEPVGGELVRGTGMTRYHVAACQLVAGKQVTASSRVEHLAQGLRPCEMCQS